MMCRPRPARRVFFIALAASLTGAPVSVPRAARGQTPAPPTASNPPAPKKTARRAATRTVSGTLAGFDAANKTLRLRPDGGGDAITVLVRDNSVFTKKGKPAAAASDFTAGERVVARVSERTQPAGEMWLRELRDAASSADYERDRKGVTAGTVVVAADDKIEVRRADGSVATFGVTKGTLVRKNGAPARLDAFRAGSPVAVQPRSAFGKLNAAVIADTPEQVQVARADALGRWRGAVQSVDAEKNTLVLKRDDDVLRTVTLAPNVVVKKARAQAPLSVKDIAPGAFVDLRLVKGVGDDGRRTAEEVRLTVPRKPRAPAAGAAAPAGKR